MGINFCIVGPTGQWEQTQDYNIQDSGNKRKNDGANADGLVLVGLDHPKFQPMRSAHLLDGAVSR